jgi:hypothetical protein
MDIDKINALYYQHKNKLLKESHPYGGDYEEEDPDQEYDLKGHLERKQEEEDDRWEQEMQMTRGEKPRTDMFDTPEKKAKQLAYYMKIVHYYLQNEVLPELQKDEPKVAKKIVQGLLDTIISPIKDIIK